MIAQSVSEILSHHVKLTVEGIDRMYLNIYVPRLQCETGIVGFSVIIVGIRCPLRP